MFIAHPGIAYALQNLYGNAWFMRQLEQQR